MSTSAIEWTEQTWNPIVGCSLKSPGCVHCYAMPMAARIEAINAAARPGHETAPHYAGTTKKVNGRAVWTGKIALAADAVLLAPLRRRKPTVYFVNSMGDLFHEDCPDQWIDRVFAVMALCPQHTFQVLTKRAARMREYINTENRCHIVGDEMLRIATIPNGFKCVPWPFPNVWLGVSTERQQEANERIPELLRTPAAIRFISYEPALGPLDLEPWLPWPEDAPDVNDKSWGCQECDGDRGCNCPNDEAVYTITEGPFDPTSRAPKWIHENRETLDWVICGGESGPRARPMHPDWARSLRDQCAAADVKFFLKQWGAFYPMIDRDHDDPDWRRDYSCVNRQPDRFRILNLAGGCGFHGERVHLMQRYSKKSTGKLLDGVAHQAMPAIRSARP